MRRNLALLTILALAPIALAQDNSTAATDSASDPAATDTSSTDTSGGDSGGNSDGNSGLTPAIDTGTPTTVIDLPPTLPSGPWNITHFVAPTRNNYWVNDNDNTAAWAPVNVATNLILTNSNKSIMAQSQVLVQNLAPGTANYKAHISGITPGNNYIVFLTLAGNPDQKLAQTQGFHIKPNSTAAIQQVVPGAAGASGPDAVAAGGANTGATGATGGGTGAVDASTGQTTDGSGAAFPSASKNAAAHTGVGAALCLMALAISALL